MRALSTNTITEINEYVNRQPWSLSTKKTAAAKLRVICSLGSTPEDIEKALEVKGYSRYTIKQYLILAGGYNAKFKKYFSSRRNLFKNAYKTKTRTVSEDEVRSLLDGAGYLYNAIYLMAFCGLRLPEALEVRRSAEVDTNILCIIGKGDKQRLVPCDISKLQPVSPSSPEAKLAGEAVSLTKLRAYLGRSGLTPHDLRAFFITRTTRSRKLDLDEVALIVGHSSLNTTQRYLRSNIEDIAKRLFT